MVSFLMKTPADKNTFKAISGGMVKKFDL
jgi:hypothetical protein